MKVLHHPNEHLRETSNEVSLEDLQSKGTQKFIDKLIETMKDKNGVGIAAPQVDDQRRIIVVDDGSGTEVFVNPRITGNSNKQVDSEEGCLSVPGVYGIVRRFKKIHFKALDRHGNKINGKIGGFKSIIIQHEIDHLDGVLFIDRAERIVEHHNL